MLWILTLVACGPTWQGFLRQYPETRCALDDACGGDYDACLDALTEDAATAEPSEEYTPEAGAACLDGLEIQAEAGACSVNSPLDATQDCRALFSQ